jgi:hypothetical protein
LILLKYKKLTALFLLLSVVYVLQTILPGPDVATLSKYHISASQLKILTLTIVIPYLIIWLIALIGYLRLRSYTQSIEGTKDGTAFGLIERGVLILTIWLPVSAVSSSITTHYYRLHPSATANMVRLDNYINLALLFAGLLIAYLGTEKLIKLIKAPVRTLPLRVALPFIGLSALYLLLVLHDPARQYPTSPHTAAAYYEPDWLIVISLIIPRLIMWFLGVQAVYNIYVYQSKVKGSLYKQALRTLALGLSGVILATIVLRTIQSVSSTLNRLNLAPLLIVIYLLLVIMCLGYVLIAKGSKSLQKIEEL